MIKYILSYFYTYETNSLTPNSMAPMPEYKFHNYACMVLPNDDDEVSIAPPEEMERKLKERYLYYQKLDALCDKLDHM